MSGSIFFDGRRFVSAGEAAEISNFTRDYVGKLCREGKLPARRIGKQWFVDFEALQKFLADQGRAHEERRVALSNERVREYQKNSADAAVAGNPAVTIAPHAALRIADRAKHVGNRSKELLDRTLVASTARHIPDSTLRALSTTAYAVTPIAELAHRFLALVLAFSLAFGIYGLVNPSAARIALLEVRDETSGLKTQVASVATVASALITGRYDDQFVALVENPHVASSMGASAGSAVGGSIGSFIGSVKSKIASLFFWRHGNQVADVAPAISIAPQHPGTIALAPPSETTPSASSHSADASSAPVRTVVQPAPIIERIVTKVISPTGVSQELLDSRLQELENKFSAMLYAATQAAPIPRAAGGIVNTIALTNRIDRLETTDIVNPTITGGTIDGTKLSNVDISANSFAVSGLTSLATTTITGDLTLSGALRFTGSSSTISAIGGVFLNATSTNLSAENASTTNATSTNFFAENASTTNATSTNLFATLGRFTSGIFDSLNATIASITGLTVTNSTTTNATSTNGYISNLTADTGTIDSLSANTADFGIATSYGLLTAPNFSATSTSATSSFAGNISVGGLTSLATTTITGSLTLSGSQTSNALTTTGDVTVGGNLTVNGDTITLGTTTSNLLVINSTINSNLVPNGNKVFDLGSPSFFWRNGFIDTLNVNNLSAASSSIGGTASETFTLNSDNATADAQDMNLVFYRGTVVPNAVLSWNSAADKKRFELNQALFISNQSGSTTQPTFKLKGVAGQTGNIFEIASSSGSTVFAIGADGSATISTSTVHSLTAGTTTLTNLSVTNTNTSSFAGNLAVGGNLTVGATATTTIDSAGNILGAGTLNLSGLGILTSGYISQASSTVAGNFTTTGTNSFGGVLNISGAITSTATGANTFPYASTTALTVSGQANIGSLAGASVSSLGTNYVPKWNSAAGVFGQSLIYDNGTQVGIGTNSNLSGALTANGTFGVQTEGDVFRQYDSGDASWYPIIARYNTNNGSFPASTFIFGNGTNARVGFEVPGGGDLTTFQVKSLTSWFNGNVGVGTTSPSSTFAVNGDTFLGGNLTVTGTTNQTELATFANGLISQASSTIGDGAQTGGLTVNGGATTTGNAYFAGKIGIGTQSPTELIEASSSGYSKIKVTGNAASSILLNTNTAGSKALALGSGTIGSTLTFDNSSYFAIMADAKADVANLSGTSMLFLDGSTGRVGIGAAVTPSVGPAVPFEVRETFGGELSRVSTVSGSAAFSTFYKNGTIMTFFGFGNAGDIFTDGLAGGTALRAQNALQFGTNGDNVRMTIDTSGNVGIGTTSPSSLFSVEGTTYLGGDTKLQGNLDFPLNATTTISTHHLGNVGLKITFPDNGADFDDGFSVGLSATQDQFRVSSRGINFGSLVQSVHSDLFNANVMAFGATSQTFGGATWYNNGTASVWRTGTVGSALQLDFHPSVTGGLRFAALTAGGAPTGGSGINRLQLRSDVVDSSGTNAFELDTTNALSTAGANLLNVKNAGTSKFVIDKDGNVGIGTTNPGSVLTVDSSANTGAAGTASLVVQGSSNKERIEIDSFGASVAPQFQGYAGGGTVAAPTQTLSGSRIFGLSGSGYDNTNTKIVGQKALILMTAAEDFTTTGNGTNISFNTTPIGGVNAAERMRISDNGNVGIGTTSPSQALSVAGNALVSGGVTASSLTVSGIASSLMVTNSAGDASAYAGSSCTNKFVRSVNGAGVATCASVSLTSDISGILPIANGGTNANAQTTNGVAYFDGTKITTGTGLAFSSGSLSITSGNLTFGAANPSISASSYIQVPQGLSISGGTFYAQNQAQFRGGIHNDSAAYLELDGGTSGYTYVNGSLGVGTTTPFRKLSVTDTVSAPQAAIAYDGTRYTQLQTDASGDYHINPSGQDAQLDDSNLWVCSGGACPAGTPTGTGNVIVENKLGIGSSTPSYPLSVEAGSSVSGIFKNTAGTQSFVAFQNTGSASQVATRLGSDSQDLVFYTNTAEQMRITSGGNVGVGTTSPSKQLSISNTLYVGAGGATGLGTATSTFQGDIKITGKLDVGTIDPPYTIDGIKYATYGESMTGVHEETTATIDLADRTADGKYAYTINFDDAAKGSDLWLFYQVTDFGDTWKDLAILLTPSFEGQVYYKKIPQKHEIVVYADQPGEVSMRLTGNRYDFSKWGNIRPDQDGNTEGTHVLSSKPAVSTAVPQTAAAASAFVQ